MPSKAVRVALLMAFVLAVAVALWLIKIQRDKLDVMEDEKAADQIEAPAMPDTVAPADTLIH